MPPPSSLPSSPQLFFYLAFSVAQAIAVLPALAWLFPDTHYVHGPYFMLRNPSYVRAPHGAGHSVGAGAGLLAHDKALVVRPLPRPQVPLTQVTSPIADLDDKFRAPINSLARPWLRSTSRRLRWPTCMHMLTWRLTRARCWAMANSGWPSPTFTTTSCKL